MVFSSHHFILCFLPLVTGVHYLLLWRGAGTVLRNLFLVCAGLGFVASWNPWFVPLMLVTAALDYRLGRIIARAGVQKARGTMAVGLSAMVNLGALAFFTSGLPAMAGASGHWIVPAGFAFWTLQNLGYCLDVCQGRSKPASSFVDYMAFVSFFPRLIAGPIGRHAEMAESLRDREASPALAARGVTRFGFGLAKMILLADPLADIADTAFGCAPGNLSAFAAWMGVTAFAFQFYFGFSACADMAIGLAGLFGFKLGENFDSPYRSESITDFWRRWHISLAGWLKNGLYLPLGGSRMGSLRTCANIVLVMLAGGLWQGAAWTFVVWAAVHALLLIFERMMGKTTFYATWPKPLRIAITFVLVLVAWVFFRAESLGDAVVYLRVMFGAGTPTAATAPLLESVMLRNFSVVHLLAGALLIWIAPTTQTFLSRMTGWKVAAGFVLSGLAVAMMLARGHARHFPFDY